MRASEEEESEEMREREREEAGVKISWDREVTWEKHKGKKRENK